MWCVWTHLAPRAASWGKSARWRGIPPGHLTRLRRSLRRNMEGVESPSRTGRSRQPLETEGDQRALSRRAYRQGVPHPHSSRITEGLGRGRPPLQKKVQDMNEA